MSGLLTRPTHYALPAPALGGSALGGWGGLSPAKHATRHHVGWVLWTHAALGDSWRPIRVRAEHAPYIVLGRNTTGTSNLIR